MFEQNTATTEQADASPSRRSYRQGERIYKAGADGKAWRLIVGSIRLDRGDVGESTFAGLAVAGDVIGAETLIFGHYAFAATALSPCVLAAWPEANASLASESLLAVLATRENRAADVLALRSGLAMERVKRLVGLLSRTGDRKTLPSLKDMADITALRLETVSRALGLLRKSDISGATNG